MNYFYLVFFALGLVIGSFLNVLIYQLEKKKRKSLRGRSFCPHCKKELGFLDLFPLFSWIFLGGKCRYCKKSISIQYPLVELGTGLIFLTSISYSILLFDNGGVSIGTIFNYIAVLLLLTINSLLIIIFVYDLKYKIIPDKIIYPTIILVLGYQLIIFALSQPFIFSPSFLVAISSAFAAGGFFYVLAAISDGKWMGGGDIKLAFFMGLLLGWPNILVGLFLGFILGAVFGVTLILLKKAEIQSEIPFGPFLIAGTWIALFWGEKVVELYLKTIGL